MNTDDSRSAKPPEILGPAESYECDFCGILGEPAEHCVRIWSGTEAEYPDELKSWEFDLCGTCFAREQKEAGMTYSELAEFNETHIDGRFDE